MKIIIFMGLFLLLVVIGVFYGIKVLVPPYPQPQGNHPVQYGSVLPMPLIQEKPKDTLILAEKETVTPLAGRISSWETYRNEKYEYEVKYPKDWEIIEAKPRVGYKAEKEINILYGKELQKITFIEKEYAIWQGEFQIRIILNPDKLSLEEWINRNEPRDISGDSLVQGISDTTLGGKVAKRLSIFGFDHEKIEIVVLYKGYIYSINFSGSNPNDMEAKRHQQIYRQILSSFRFFE